MRIDSGRFNGARGVPLFFQSWHPDRPARAVMVIVHGLGEHSGCYEEFARYFVERGFSVEAFDLRGNGNSPGPRGYVARWKLFREDLDIFIRRVWRAHPGRPVVLFGHSLGGAVALDYALRQPTGLAAVVASAPAIGTVRVSRFHWALARLMDVLWPTFTVRVFSESDLTEDPANPVDYHDDDPLSHSRGSARLGMELRRTSQFIQEHANEWTLPLFIVHSPQDKVASIDGSRRFAAAAPNVVFREYDVPAHELYNDASRDRVLADTAAWIDARLP